MMNMEHCRFNNTVEALQECIDAVYDELSPAEHEKRNELAKTCAEFLQEWIEYRNWLDRSPPKDAKP